MNIDIVKDVEILDREILVSQKIEGILRRVEGQVLLFIQHYSGILDESEAIKENDDILKIKNCLPQLINIMHIIESEISEFDRMCGDLLKRGVDEEKIQAIRKDLKNTLVLLDAYIQGIKNITINLQSGDITPEKAKEVLKGRVKSLQERYTAFFNANKLHILDLMGLLKNISRN